VVEADWRKLDLGYFDLKFVFEFVEVVFADSKLDE
jgi:hypothetical protein